MDLFDEKRRKSAPLAERMRCVKLEDFIGQTHLIDKNSILSRAIRADRLGSCIFYGPPGTGKSTLANIIAESTGARFKFLNAVSSGVSDAKNVVEEAKVELSGFGRKTYLTLEECHRWSKAQSDSILSAVEKGEIIFIGTTTENPYVSMTRAIVSRCRIFEFKELTPLEIKNGLKRALENKERGLGNYNIIIDDLVLQFIAESANGDMRTALNALELAVLSSEFDDNGAKITLDVAEQCIQKRAMSVNTDLYYNLISAFCKSLRGSDPDAALYYAMRIIEAGGDPLLICRRLIVHSAEDVGLADPRALTIAVSAMQAFEKIGLPEGRIPLTEAIIYVALAPKSNSVVTALYSAVESVKDANDVAVPSYLCDQSYSITKNNKYKYPHDYGGYVEQQYLPDKLKDKVFYKPSTNGYESHIVILKKKK